MYSKGLAILGMVMMVASSSGCSIKNYGRQPDLTDAEKSTMSCGEIDMEQAKVQDFIQHVNEESGFDGRSVLSFLVDFGIGNTIEKRNALASATTRLEELKNFRSGKCASSPGSVEAIPAIVPAATPTAVNPGKSVEE